MKDTFKTSSSDLVRIFRELRRYNTPLLQFAVGIENFRATLQDGRVKDGIIPAGQVMGLFTDIPSCKELIDRMMLEADLVLASLCNIER